MPIELLTTGEGEPLADCCGLHIVAGNVILNKSDIPRALVVALGDGVGGQWDACEKLWYHGEELDPSIYHFHPGAPSSGLTDPVQGVDSFFPAGLTYSHTAYIVVQFDATVDEVDASGVIGRYRTKQLPNFDATGAETGRSFSSNPARWAAYNMIVRSRISPARIDWPSWCAWRDSCDTLINWNDGVATATRQIKRFEAHVAYTEARELIDVLNHMCDLTAHMWQDDGEKIYFRPLWGQTSSFTFDNTNMIDGSFSAFEVDIRELPTRQVIKFRNLDSEFLAPSSWDAKDQSLIDQVGIRNGEELNYGPMTYSQAMRLATFRLRMASLTKRLEFRSTSEGFAVLPGDFVTINHEGVGTLNVLVLDTEDEASSADTRRIVAAVVIGDLYSDTDHEPIPAQVDIPTTPEAG